MRIGFLISMVLLVCALSTSAWGVCSPEPNDMGICDSIYVEKFEDTTSVADGGFTVRFPISIWHDVSDNSDTLLGIAFTLCYTHTNPGNYCSLSSFWNRTTLSGATLPRSIFRHLVDKTGSDTTHNWMLDLFDQEGTGWANIIIDLDGISHFWLSLLSSAEPAFREDAKKTLMATMTFRIQDTMTICIDTCFWPPAQILQFSRADGIGYTPRMADPGDGLYSRCIKADVKEIHGSDGVKPSEFQLSQNYPNPFNPATNFRFTLAKSSHVRVEIFNIVGQKVRTLVDEDMKPGVYVADWDGKDENGNPVSSGIYFYRMQARDFSDMKKMVLLK